MSKPIYLYKKRPFRKPLCAHKNVPVSVFELPSSHLGNIKLLDETGSFILYECELSTECQLYSSNVPGVWYRLKRESLMLKNGVTSLHYHQSISTALIINHTQLWEVPLCEVLHTLPGWVISSLWCKSIRSPVLFVTQWNVGDQIYCTVHLFYLSPNIIVDYFKACLLDLEV